MVVKMKELTLLIKERDNAWLLRWKN